MQNKETQTYGYFDNAKKEYVITDPKTPFPWINYLGVDGFYSLVSNTGGGYTFYKDAKFRRLTRYRYNNIPMDSGGKYFYIADGDTCWSPSWKPMQTKLDSYECRHGMSYTRFIAEKNWLRSDLVQFIPLGSTTEVIKLTLENKSSTRKQLKLYSLIEWCLWNAEDDMTNFQRNFSTGEVEIEGSTIYHKTEFKERRNHYAFFHVNQAISGFDTDREQFMGLYNGFTNPEVVQNRQAKNTIAKGWSPIGSHELSLELAPGEVEEIIFQLGYVEVDENDKWESKGVINKAPAHAMIQEFNDADKIDKALMDLEAYWEELLGSYQVTSEDPEVDRIVNIWNQYQCMVTFNMSRSASFFESGIGRGMGFRDSNQDLLGAVHMIPDRARERIIDIASTQFEDGSCYHQYQPLTKKGNAAIGGNFNDDPLWLILSTVAYIKETGDFQLLEEPVPFDHKADSGAIHFDHLKASFYHVVNNLGPHGLPLIGRADWNDCLNLNCFSKEPNESFQTTENQSGGVAESLMIAGLFVYAGKEFIELCDRVGKADEARLAQKHIDQMTENVIKYGWDGDWFLRAYDFYGNKIGSESNEEGKIFIESQAWCSMAGIGMDEGLVEKSLDAVKKHLDSEHGIVLNYPAFSKYEIAYGEISTYPAGYKENGGIFCHNNPWVMIAETLMGRGDRAYDYYRKICPGVQDERMELHKVEPYVYAQMIAGKEAVTPGQAKNSWLTGTASWNFYAISQFILGIQPSFDGLIIDPCLPTDWKEVRVKRRFRGIDYDIEILKPNGSCKGVKSVYLNDQKIEGNKIPIIEGPALQKVKVIM